MYTIGQRDNLGLSGGPWYVDSVDIEKNEVNVVHLTQSKNKLVSSVQITGVNIFKPLIEDYQYTCITRYNQDPIKCNIVYKSKEIINVQFDDPVYMIAYGQSLVIYDGLALVAGGVMFA